MPISKLNRSKRYIRTGVTKVYYLPTAVDYTALTRTELDAGTDLTTDIVDVSGWSTASNNVDTPDWESRFTSKVPGLITADDSSINFYASSDTDDVRAVLPRDTSGYIVWLDGGDVPAQNMDVFPVTVSAVSPQRTSADAAQITVNFAITAEPSENQVIPAAG